MRICAYVLAAGLLVSSLQLIAQVPDPVVAAQAPAPGSGHQYIGIGAETVNPADGSLSFDLPFKPPVGRGLSMNFGIRFSGTEQFSLSNTPPGGQATLAFIPNWQHGQAPWQVGAWSYDLPIVTARTSVYTTAYIPNNGCPNGVCTYSLNFCWGSDSYVFRGLDGTQSSLPIGTIYNDANNYQQNFCGVTPAKQSPGNKHGILSYLLSGTQVEVVDHSGTTYQFPTVEGAEPQQPSMYPSMGGALATTITDRNGNQITLSGNTSYKDATGRTAVSWTGIGNSGDQITVAGLSGPVTLQWITTPVSFPESGHNINGGTCNLSTPSTTISVVSEIDLPNSTKYSFQYDGTYGRVSKVTFPSGGYVRYVWGLNPSAALTHASWNANNTPYSCDFIFDVPAVTDRYVSFDGTNEVLHQQFQYSTSWSGASWTSKQTIVTATDLVTGQSTKTTYNYGPLQGDNNVYIAVNPLLNQIPVETNVMYQDGTGSTTYKTVNKTWANPHIMLGDQTILDNGQGSATERCYDANEQVTNFLEYGFQSDGAKPADPTCYSSAVVTGALNNTAIGSLKRQTATSYHPYFQWNGSSNPPTATGTHIVNAPDSVTVADGAGSTAKQTLYAYDQNGLQGSGAINLTNPGSTRANITTLQQLIGGSAYTTTTYSYWDTGQVYSMTDPCGNTTCNDVTGTNHTTYYHYADSYQSGTGTPPGQTNAYLTEVDYPNTGVAHTVKFSWGYSDGQIRSSIDENNQATSFTYADPLGRLTQIDYPDTGQTKIIYNDSPYSATSPSMTVSKKLDSTPRSVTTVTLMDGLGHERQTQLANSYFVDSTYNGFGQLRTKSNPHLSGSSPSDGLTTYDYDVLGRTITVTHPDGNASSTSYAGRAIKTTDEGNGTRTVQRVSQSDVFGNLVSVCEITNSTGQGGTSAPVSCGQDIAATGYLTNYAYNLLGNMTSVSQGAISRSYTYDDLARLITSSNPESGTICYGTWNSGNCISGYDANGNVSVKTDARSIATNYQYDVLNRALSKSYSDGTTPSAQYTYDTSSESGALYTTGRLTYTKALSGSTLLAQRSLVTYDPMGRLKTELQCTPANCAGTQYSLQYTYDLAGNLYTSSNGQASTPYTLTYSYDTANHLQQVTSTWNDAQHPSTLFSAQPYAPFGLSDATIGANIQLHRDYNNRGFLYHEADQGQVATPATPGTGTATINFTEQLQGTPGTGSVTVNGGEQSTQVQTAAAAPGTGSITISGSERYYNYTYVCGPFGQTCTTQVSDSGNVSATVNGVTETVSYNSSSTSSSLASALANAFNGDGNSPVTASASGSTVTVTAKTSGAGTNYSLSATSWTTVTQFFSSSSFPASTSGANLTGGHDAQYTTVFDSGTVSVTVNSVISSSSFGQSSTTSSIASDLASKITLSSANVNASASGNVIYLTAKTIGVGTNYSLSTSYSYDTGHFGGSSFTGSPSGGTLTGGTNNGISDAGTVQLIVNGSFSKTVSYGSSSTASSIASGLASAFNGDGSSPVTMSASAATLTITSKGTGSGTNYGWSFSSTYDTAHFSSSSFHGPSSGALSGGNNSGLGPATIYSYTLSFEPNGNVASTNDSAIGVWNYGVSGTPGYDDENRLVYASSSSGRCAGANLSWSYDRYGNRWSQSATGSSGCMIAQPSLTFNGGTNRIDGWSYDASGDLLNDGAHNYTYDGGGRIASVDGSTKYVYDAEGRRVAKENSGGAVIASYVLSLGGDQITEMNGSGQWIHSNVYASGRVLTTYDSAGTRFQLTDSQGTRRVQAHIDGTAGLTCFNYPFGDGLSCSGSDEDATEQHYTGKEHDSESGLENFGARYDSSSLGRFMTPDWSARPTAVPYAEFGDPQSLNLYGYVRNDPVTRADTDGHQDCYGFTLICQLNWQADGQATGQTNKLKNQRSLLDRISKFIYFKAEGGFGLGLNVKAGPVKGEVEVKNTWETKNSSEGDTKSEVKEVGVKVELGGAKAGLSVGSTKVIMENNENVDRPATPTHTVGYEKGNFKGSNSEIGIGASICAGLCGGVEGGIRGDQVLDAIGNEVSDYIGAHVDEKNLGWSPLGPDQ